MVPAVSWFFSMCAWNQFKLFDTLSDLVLCFLPKCTILHLGNQRGQYLTVMINADKLNDMDGRTSEQDLILTSECRLNVR